MTMSKALVGPLPTIRFHDGTKLVYAVPRNSCDVRYRRCQQHHPACDCREAEHAEQFGEYRSMIQDSARAAARLLVGHRVKDYSDLDRRTRAEIGDELWWRYCHGGGPLACQCTGCQLVRAGEISVWTDDQGVVTPDALVHVR